MTSEQGRTIEPTAQEKLQEVYKKYVSELEVISAVRHLLYKMAGKVEKAAKTSDDFSLTHESFGMETGAVIKNIEVSSLSNFEFKRFPFQKLYDEGVLSLDEKVECLMIPNIFGLRGKSGEVTAQYSGRDLIIEYHLKDGDLVFPMEDKDPIERALAIAELLQAVDREVDRKIQTATPA